MRLPDTTVGAFYEIRILARNLNSDPENPFSGAVQAMTVASLHPQPRYRPTHLLRDVQYVVLPCTTRCPVL
eukprot:2143720-Rhodomonas_salina.6